MPAILALDLESATTMFVSMAIPRQPLHLAVLAAAAILAVGPASVGHAAPANCWTPVLNPADDLLGVGGVIWDVAA
jgi:hypothetical protein